MAQNYCSNCGEKLKEFAIVCSSCGTPTKEQQRQQNKNEPNQEEKKNDTEKVNAEKVYRKNTNNEQIKSPFIALILSFFIIGLGQVYNGRFWKGVGFLIAMPIGLLFLIIPGILIWIWGLYDAYTDAEKINRGEVPYKEPTVWEIIIFLFLPFILVFLFFFLVLLFFVGLAAPLSVVV